MQLSSRTIVAAAVLAVVGAAALQAQGTNANFTGTWTLDVLNSQVGDNGPSAATYTIAQHGDTLTMDRETTSAMMGTIKSHLVQGIDGRVWKNTVSAGGESIELSSTASWAHDTLSARSSGSAQGTDFTEEDRMIMAPDGKSFTMVRAVSAGGQDFPSMTMVFVKKP
ncbi:MAG: hypothetical protein ACRELE_07300 [Gemmatimonadales bacterium]